MNAHINCSLQHNGKFKTIIDISWQCRHSVAYTHTHTHAHSVVYPQKHTHIRTYTKVNHTEIYGFLKVSSTKIIQCIVFIFYLFSLFCSISVCFFLFFGVLCVLLFSVAPSVFYRWPPSLFSALHVSFIFL